jgi:hypothetical protein
MSNTLRNAKNLMPGDKFLHQGREHVVESRSSYQGTVKVKVEGFKFPLDLAPLRELEIIEDISEAEAA